MATTIQLSEELKEALSKQKLKASETYEDVIWDLIEDRMALSEETEKAIARAHEDIKKGQTIPLADIEKKYGIR